MRYTSEQRTDFNRAGNLACHVKHVTLEGAEAERGDGGIANVSRQDGHGTHSQAADQLFSDRKEITDQSAHSQGADRCNVQLGYACQEGTDLNRAGNLSGHVEYVTFECAESE